LDEILPGFGKMAGHNRHFILSIAWPDLTGPLTSFMNQRENRVMTTAVFNVFWT
jgi:hypothetical protein